MIRQFFDTMIVASTDKVVIMTQQNLFFIRTTRTWNLLTGRMDLANATLTSFKSLLYDYYSRVVRVNYNPDNPRMFKTICLNSTRFLEVPIMCCM